MKILVVFGESKQLKTANRRTIKTNGNSPASGGSEKVN
jgi:hypothetical protein